MVEFWLKKPDIKIKKILYLFSDTGGGHRASAIALIETIDSLAGHRVEQKMVDVFAECSGFLNFFARLYGPVTRYIPQLWGALYYWLDDTKKLDYLLKIALPFIRMELTKLFKYYNPDVVVSVHPLVNHLSIEAMKHLTKKIPILTIITDPVTIHKAWVCPQVNQIVVATEFARKRVLEYKMDPKRVKLYGLPIDPKFLRKRNKLEIRKELHLVPDVFTVMIMGGGEGSGEIFEIVQNIYKSKIQAQLIVVCGRNAKLKKRLDNLHHVLKTRVFGFTTEVPALMDAADIIVTKAGPGSIAEAMSKELPMIITSWIPGQEEGNVEYVKRNELGFVERDPKKVADLVIKLSHHTVLNKFKRNIDRTARPRASFEIAKLIMHYL